MCGFDSLTICVKAALRKATDLWQHLVLASPAQSYGQQVVHHRSRLQTDDPVIVMFGNPAQDSITVGLKNTHANALILTRSKQMCINMRYKRLQRHLPWTRWWAAATALPPCSLEDKTGWAKEKVRKMDDAEPDWFKRTVEFWGPCWTSSTLLLL